MIVYMVYNRVNGKQYVGKTVKYVARRWSEHLAAAKRGSKYYLHAAIRKYGVGAFLVVPLSHGASSEEELAEQERYFIQRYHTNDTTLGYNLTDGGEGTTGFRHSAETKDKLRKSKLGVPSWNKGVSPSDATRKKIGAAHKGNKYCVGRTLSDATKQKISMKARGRPTSDTLRQVRSQNAQGSNNPMYGRSQKETTRNFISQKRLEREKTDHTSSRNIIRVNHVRWHTNRGIVSNDCSYCEGAA
jgi:group I intron endonuclease